MDAGINKIEWIYTKWNLENFYTQGIFIGFEFEFVVGHLNGLRQFYNSHSIKRLKFNLGVARLREWNLFLNSLFKMTGMVFFKTFLLVCRSLFWKKD